MTIFIPWPGGMIEDHRAMELPIGRDGHVTYVSAEDFDWLQQWHWYPMWDGKGSKQYVVRHERRGGREARVTKIYMHIAVLLRAKGPKPNLFGSRGRLLKIIGDHENGNSLDNRRENLRYATMSQNNANRFGLAYRELDFNVAAHHLED